MTLQIATGIYELAETLCFTPDDGGTAECLNRYQLWLDTHYRINA